MSATKIQAARSAFNSSVGRKFVMAVTGLFLCSFLVMHLIGNLQLLKNDQGAAFNTYAEFMSTNPMIRASEIILALGFIIHIFQGLSLALKNRGARPVGYKVYKGSENSTFFSRFMVYSGVIVLIFLFLHLWQFWFQHRFGLVTAGESMYDTTVKVFQQPIFSVVYMVAFFLLAFHLNHGFQSTFQSLGLTVSTPLGKRLKMLGMMFSVLICGGFLAIPFYFLFFYNA